MLRCLIFLALVSVTLQSPQSSDIDLTPSKLDPAASNGSCITQDNEKGFCVIYYQCKKNRSINVDGEMLIDLRFKEDCPHYLDMCCQLPDVTPETTPPPVPPPQKEGCGWRNPNGISVQVPSVDNEAGFAEFPWMVAVLQFQKADLYLGGGSLIHPKAVLTAAHVVDGKTGLKVRAGEWDSQTVQEIYPHQDRDVASVIIHKDYIKQILFYDIALLFLSSPMDLAPNVGVVCLPPPDAYLDPGTRCFASGWGKTNFGKEGLYSVILKKVEVPVVNKRECRNKLIRTILGPEFELHTSFMCAGGEKDVDACKGDGGSPLVCPIAGEKNRYYQAGIVAWGIGCGSDGVPGVYVDVVKLFPWIDDKLRLVA